MKGILSKEHIAIVENEAQKPHYRLMGAFCFGKDPLTIIKMSQKGLILIKGTDDTGHIHISQRHFSNSKTYWDNFYDHNGTIIHKKDRIGRKKYRLDNPSSFHSESLGFIDIPNIADQIYHRKNLDNSKNKHNELFDIYVGLAKGMDENRIKYKLITYKNSKIIHTLFPLTKEFNHQKKRITNFARQSPGCTIGDSIQINIPYIDEHKIKRYIFILRQNPYDHTIENSYIQVNAPSGKPLITTYFGSQKTVIDLRYYYKDFDRILESYLWLLQKANLNNVEKRIRNIESRLVIEVNED